MGAGTNKPRALGQLKSLGVNIEKCRPFWVIICSSWGWFFTSQLWASRFISGRSPGWFSMFQHRHYLWISDLLFSLSQSAENCVTGSTKPIYALKMWLTAKNSAKTKHRWRRRQHELWGSSLENSWMYFWEVCPSVPSFSPKTARYPVLEQMHTLPEKAGNYFCQDM